jgi:predicted nucleotidyltransferase
MRLDTTSLGNAVERLDLAPAHRRIVLDLLGANLPQGSKVWVFGSRATGQARRYSDLHLALDAGRRLKLDASAALREAFTESDLPYRVDVVDWHAIDDRLRRLIAERFPFNPPAEEARGN